VPSQKLWTPADEISTTFVKSKFVNRARKIYVALNDILRENGVSYEASEPNFVHPSEELLQRHYAHILNLSFTESMIKEFFEKGVVLKAYRGPGIVSAIVYATGITSPSRCEPWQVRAIFSKDDLEEALAEGRAVENVLHRTRKKEESEEEARRWWAYIRTKFKSKDI